MNERKGLHVQLGDSQYKNTDAILDVLRVGTSTGGARPKAVIAMNKQGDVPEDYDYWLLKFDGMTDLDLGEPGGYVRIEYTYTL